jgi:hypothetical protein
VSLGDLVIALIVFAFAENEMFAVCLEDLSLKGRETRR